MENLTSWFYSLLVLELRAVQSRFDGTCPESGPPTPRRRRSFCCRIVDHFPPTCCSLLLMKWPILDLFGSNCKRRQTRYCILLPVCLEGMWAGYSIGLVVPDRRRLRIRIELLRRSQVLFILYWVCSCTIID